MMSEEKLLELLEKAFEAGEQHEERRNRDAIAHIDRVQSRRNALNKLIENV